MRIHTKLLIKRFEEWINKMTIEEGLGNFLAILASIGANIWLRKCLINVPMHNSIKEIIIFLIACVMLRVLSYMFTVTIFIIEMLIEIYSENKKKE